MLEYFILGVIQGIFEWLPVSSEGVASLFSHFFIEDLNAVDLALFLHLGTLMAAIIYFRRDWWAMINFREKKLMNFLIITTIISLVIGYPLYHLVRTAIWGQGILLITGLGLLLTAYLHKKNIKWKVKEKYLSLILGILQGLAVIPGVSRSGITIFGLSLGKTEPKKILKISYLMSVPIVLASSFYLFLKQPLIIFKAWPALLVSFLIGFLCLHFLITWAKKINFVKFLLVFSSICFLGFIIGVAF